VRISPSRRIAPIPISLPRLDGLFHNPPYFPSYLIIVSPAGFFTGKNIIPSLLQDRPFLRLKWSRFPDPPHAPPHASSPFFFCDATFSSWLNIWPFPLSSRHATALRHFSPSLSHFFFPRSHLLSPSLTLKRSDSRRLLLRCGTCDRSPSPRMPFPFFL